MSDLDLKRQIMLTIGGHIDEVTLVGAFDSFVEMDQCVVHVVVDGSDHYFRIDLTRVDESKYFDPYNPKGE